MGEYKIVTDATADITLEDAAAIDIAVIPMQFMMGEESCTFGLGEGDITAKEFYDSLKAGKTASTSQITPYVYEEFFSKYLKEGLDILYVCFSSGLSDTINSARVAVENLKEEYPDRKVLIVDTLCASVGEAMMCDAVARKKRDGMSMEDLAKWVEDNRDNACHWFTVADLGHLARGGRISAVTAIAGTALNIKPILHLDITGHLVNVTKVRGRKKSIGALVDKFKEGYDAGYGKEVFIGHGDCIEDSNKMADGIREVCPDINVHIYPVGPIIGAHTGPDILLVSYFGNNK